MIEAWLRASEKTTSPSPRQRRHHARVRQEARAEQQAGLGALERGQLLLEAAVDRHVARDQARGPRARAVAHRGLGGRLAHARVVGQAEVVVRAQQQHRARRRAARAAPAGPTRSAACGRGRGPDVLQAFLYARRSGLRSREAFASGVLGSRLGPPSLRPCVLGLLGSRASTWTSSGTRSALRPGGAARRSCCGGAAAWTGPRSWPRPASRSARRPGCAAPRRRASPSGCRGAGSTPLSAWRATLSPSSSNIARSSSGSEPSVVRKLPIITPLMPGLDGERVQLAEVLDRARRRAGTAPPGRISRKIAIHLTASHGSM